MADRIVNSIENKQVDRAESVAKSLQKYLPSFHKNYHQAIDEELFVKLLPLLLNELDDAFVPVELKQLVNKFDDEKLLKKIFRKSILIDQKKLNALLEKGTEKQLLKLRKDPIIAMYNQLKLKSEMVISPKVKVLYSGINMNLKKYMAGLMEMKKGQAFYPDANLTLRVAYGQVEGYEPKDGVKYKHYTTLSGIIAKDNSEIYDYDVPDRLKELYHNKNFGKYEIDGEVPVCFTASNHTTGGNSGSPVVNGNGELIGVNFDRCWEGTMSDIMFDPERCRNIAIDIRYALFIIDKFAGAGYLLDEMEIVF